MGGKNNKEKKKEKIKKKNNIEQPKKKKDFTEEFEEIFLRDFKKNFFREFSKNIEKDYDMDKIWNINLDEDRLKNKNKNSNEKAKEINKKVYNDYENILKKYNYNTEDKTEFGENIQRIFCTLCNIYDLIPNYLEMYFQDHWIEMHLKLFNICIDFQNLPKVYILVDDKNKIYSLEYFLTLFCICMSKDEDYFHSIYILKKYPDFFYKVLVIAIYITNVCCCGHGLRLNDNLCCSCFKTGQIIFEIFKYADTKNISINIKETKMKCVDFMVKNLGKNVCSVYLLKMGEMCNNKDDIFNHLINESNLLNETLNREGDEFGHCINHLEEFMSMCKSPDLLFKILVFISPPKAGIKRRVFREILKILTNIVNDKDVENLEKSLYNSIIFQKILETLKYDIWLGEYEGIWRLLLNPDNQCIIKIFHKNKYDVTKIFMQQVDNCIEKQLIDMRLTAVIRLMTLFIKVGEKVKNQFGGENFYVNEFKGIYLKLSDLSSLKDYEDYKEFEQYFK